MRNEKYIYKDYLHMSTEEKKLWKQYKAAADEDEKTETLAKIKEIRGVYTTKHEDDKITESVSEMKFVK